MPAPPLKGFDHLPTCSVVVCTRDRPSELERCLQSLRNLCYPTFEVVVVDNAPSNSPANELALRYSARYLLDPIQGNNHARNVGARACETEIVAYLDDDSAAEPEWLQALAVEFEDPQVMAVVGRSVPSKLETDAERLWWQTFALAWGVEHRLVLDKGTPNWLGYAIFGGVGAGGSMAFRRSAFEVWPGFDERLGRGMPLDAYDEDYAFFSLLRRGYKIVATPTAIARHPCPSTLDALGSRLLKDRAALIGYLCLLLAEEKGYRLQILRHMFRKLQRRGLKSFQRQVPSSVVPRRRLFLAQLRGPWLYLMSTLKERRQSRIVRAQGSR